ncbi:MAG: QacE family quaternary ammonium compound efflux SMR transporter [Gammaproteobacteria bacterium]|nr:QacE family quaternary ammonium compound efflux SMR transporter [Gammaproteobacteria bacterium]
MLFFGIAVFESDTSNSFAKSTEGFTLLLLFTIIAITIVLYMYTLSLIMNIMKNIPMVLNNVSFAVLTIIVPLVVGFIRFNEVPNLYSLNCLAFIITGVLMVNLLVKI